MSDWSGLSRPPEVRSARTASPFSARTRLLSASLISRSPSSCVVVRWLSRRPRSGRVLVGARAADADHPAPLRLLLPLAPRRRVGVAAAGPRPLLEGGDPLQHGPQRLVEGLLDELLLRGVLLGGELLGGLHHRLAVRPEDGLAVLVLDD